MPVEIKLESGTDLDHGSEIGHAIEVMLIEVSVSLFIYLLSYFGS
jgi:hypothetical protein